MKAKFLFQIFVDFYRRELECILTENITNLQGVAMAQDRTAVNAAGNQGPKDLSQIHLYMEIDTEAPANVPPVSPTLQHLNSNIFQKTLFVL